MAESPEFNPLIQEALEAKRLKAEQARDLAEVEQQVPQLHQK